ncbi:MAG: hypothetical protein PUB95_06600 [Methanobrevibacter ruminantium]|uniref:hypothetical protein n=1 Tax=Methanobrevibacter ruminantium TaxID=83816 RepID=UPI0026EC1A0E|nr:hypothetical protein [Methanobrevibacter ruminantium]MCI5737902.1 hypothetical protein [Methanobrevibacter ruminantium]MDD6049108.1 hypothetical protein [Methanobrevibacter ruminantium]
MFNISLALSYFFSGFFMKLSDDEYDEKSNKAIAILLGIVCGLFTAYACSIDLDAACIFIAILIGNILAFKVDGIHHIATMASFIIAFLFLGLQSFTYLSIITIIICMIGAIIDEIGNDNEKIYSKSKFLEYFFDYRFALKVVILLLVLIGLLNIWSFIYFLCFEIAYEIARLLFENYIA